MKKLFFTFLLCTAWLTTFAQLPFQNEYYPDNVIVTGDFIYGNQSHSVLRLYTPNNQAGKPLLVLVVGSGFTSGPNLRDLPNVQAKARSFARRGYAVIVMEYKRVDQPCYGFYSVVREAAADVHAAIQFTIANRAAWNIDPNYIFIHGISAGGIAATSAIWCSDQRFQNKFGISKGKNSLYPWVGYNIKGLALESSGVLEIDIFENADLNSSVPIVMSQGIGDPTVPYGICGNSDLCTNKPAISICGTGRMLQSITTPGNPKSGTCYQMYKYLSYFHNLESSGPNMETNLKNNVAAGFAWIIANQPCVQNSVYLYPNRIGNEEPVADEPSLEHIQFYDDQLAFHLSAESGTSQFRLFDSNGMERKQQAVNNNSLVSTKDLSAGIYIAVLESDSGTIKKKIVVQR
jgi:hypothetical protein